MMYTHEKWLAAAKLTHYESHTQPNGKLEDLCLVILCHISFIMDESFLFPSKARSFDDL